MSLLEKCYLPVSANPWTDLFPGEASRPNHSRKAPGARPSVRPFGEWAREEFLSRKDKPLALYLHVPFCRHRCLFCPFYQNRTEDGFSAGYADRLVTHIERVAGMLGGAARRRPVDAVYCGGGTPSDLDTPDLARVLRSIQEHFAIVAETEITVEGRVRDFTWEKVQAWREAGANRFSLGLQTTDETLRRRLGRLAKREEILATLRTLSESEAILIVDLLFGLPGQTQEMLQEDLRFLAEETGIHGLDLYELIQFPHSPLAQAIQKGKPGFPPPPGKTERGPMFREAARTLGAHGFEHFTPQHWRRSPRERSVYNRMAKGDSDILPFGSSAGGNLGRTALMVERNLEAYAEQIDAGVLPVKALAPMGPESDRERFKNELAAAAENLELPRLEKWPEALRSEAPSLVQNWSQGGLLAETATQGSAPLTLTTAGAFWIKTMHKHLLGSLDLAPVA
ncbi:MAG: radical SAM protein [Puniceicoccales bacterium]